MKFKIKSNLFFKLFLKWNLCILIKRKILKKKQFFKIKIKFVKLNKKINYLLKKQKKNISIWYTNIFVNYSVKYFNFLGVYLRLVLYSFFVFLTRKKCFYIYIWNLLWLFELKDLLRYLFESRINYFFFYNLYFSHHKFLKSNLVFLIQLKQKKVMYKFFNTYYSKLNIRYKKKIKLRLSLNILKKKKRLKTKNIFLWFFINKKNINKSKTKYRFWKFWFSKYFKFLYFKLRMWPKKKRGIKWSIFFKNIYFLNLYTTFLQKNIFQFFFRSIKINKQFNVKLNNIYLLNKKLKKKNINWIFFSKFKKTNQKKKIKKIIKLFFWNYFFQVNFLNLNLSVVLRSTFSKKKLNFFNYTFISLLQNSRFKKWNYLSKQYFLSFIFLIWYKSIYFLSYFLWNTIKKNQKREKKTLHTCFNFLQALPLREIGVIGFKILIQGKLFKKPRTKSFKLAKGKLPLTNPSVEIKFARYFIVTRAGTYSFNFWISCIE